MTFSVSERTASIQIAGFSVVEEGSSVSELLQRITVKPTQCGGRPCVRGMRIRFSDVLDLLASGLSPAEILAEMPDLEPDDIRARVAYAGRFVAHPVLAA